MVFVTKGTNFLYANKCRSQLNYARSCLAISCGNPRVAGVGGSSWILEDMLNKPSLGALDIGPTMRPSG